MRRRGFLATLLGGAAATALDPVAMIGKICTSQVACEPVMGCHDLVLYDRVLKEWYEQHWVDELNRKATLFRLMRKRRVTVYGRRMTIPLRTGRAGTNAT